MTPNLISQGAEAKIFLDKNIINKERISKSYRHPVLDEQIRRLRTKHECKILIKANRLGMNVPKVLNADSKSLPKDKFNLQLEYLQGDRLSETLNNYEENKQFKVMKKIGEQTSLLHKNNIIHGDLTTSNTILNNNDVYIIDFGLSFISTKIEDKAVDLHLIKQALEAKHWQNWEKLFEKFLEYYSYSESEKVINRLNIVEKRGRYKH